MVVTNPDHREHRRGDLEAAARAPSPARPALHAVLQNRMLQGRQAQRLLGAGEQQPAGGAQHRSRRRYPGYRNPDNFIVVSDAYPTVTAMAADLILPAAMWVEKEGAYGNAERRTQFWHQLVDAPGRGALRPVAADGVLQALHHRRGLAGRSCWTQDPEYRGKTLFEVLFANGQVDAYPLTEADPELRATTRPSISASTSRRACSRNTPRFGRGHGHDLAPVRRLSRGARPALAGRERRGDALALPRGIRPLRDAGPRASSSTASPTAARSSSRVPYEPPAESPDEEFDFWLVTGRVLEHWHSGSMTHARARALQGVPGRAGLHERRSTRATCGLNRGSEVRVVSRRGEIISRVETRGPQQDAARPWSSCRGSTPAS